MLPSIHRLTKKKDFDAVFKQGKTIKEGVIIGKIYYNRLTEDRFGFVVSKKVSKKATIRNTVKRRLRQSVLYSLRESPKKSQKSLDVVIIALPGIEKKKFTEIQGLVGNFLKNI